MLTIVLSLLFGVIAFAALAEIRASVAKGLQRGRLIRAELAKASPPRAALSREVALRSPRPAALRHVAA